MTDWREQPAGWSIVLRRLMAPSFREQRLAAALRQDSEGRWAWGTVPTVTCQDCGLRYDPREAPVCPGCMAYHARRDRERWLQIVTEYAIEHGGGLPH